MRTEQFEFIRKRYRPLQPSVLADNEEIIYREVRPDNHLKNLVYCYWQLKTPTPLHEPFLYRVVSDGCIDVFFEHEKSASSFVMGFCRKYTEFDLGKEFSYIGIRFLPCAFPILFELDAQSLSNKSQPLKNISPEHARWIRQHITREYSFVEIAGILNQRLGEQLNEIVINPDSRFLNALRLILEKKGNLDTEVDLDTGLSPRQLRRKFNQFIGTTPKAFCNVIRFQHILNAKPSGQSLKENKLYYDLGFFDQAHFIKDFKNFYGVTPRKAFR